MKLETKYFDIARVTSLKELLHIKNLFIIITF